jgi:hypothetical protein
MMTTSGKTSSQVSSVERFNDRALGDFFVGDLRRGDEGDRGVAEKYLSNGIVLAAEIPRREEWAIRPRALYWIEAGETNAQHCF